MATTYLHRTPSGAGDLRKWTFATWIKRGVLSVEEAIITWFGPGSEYTQLRWQGADTLNFAQHDGSGYTGRLNTNAIFKDPGAWYHLVCVWDTDNAAAGDRMRLYINGVEETSFSTDTNPALNLDSYANSTNQLTIGSKGAANYFTGSMAHTHFCDGQAYAASDFGETDSTSGIWVPNNSPSVTYGTNGFFLKYASGAEGTDSSGNGNDMTVSGTMTQTKDTPQDNFCTLNPLARSFGTTPTLSNGNTTTTTADSWVASTVPIHSGKWYWEVKVPSAGVECVTGVLQANASTYEGNNWIGLGVAGVYAFAAISGNKITDGTSTSYDSAISQNDIMMFAMDAEAGSLYVGVNGTWLQSSNPVTSTSPMTSSMDTDALWVPFTTISSTGGTCINNFNFGNGYFGTTLISSPEADDAGLGAFAYDVPAGYYSLCPNNLGDQS